MCIFPTLAVRVCVLVIIPLTAAFCLAEITVSIITLSTIKDPDILLNLILVASLLYLIALGVGLYGSIVRNIVCVQVMLFAIAADLLVKLFVSIIRSNSNVRHKEVITNFWFHGSFTSSVLCFLFAFIYFLRLKDFLYDDN